MSRYLLAESALADLREIRQFVEENHGPERSRRLTDRFASAFEMLSAAPGAGFARPSLARLPVRWWAEAGFLIGYDSKSRPIVVLRVVHGAREAARLMRAVRPRRT